MLSREISATTWRRRPVVFAIVAAALAGLAWPAAAQETRVEAITTEQAEKAKTVKPYEVGTWEHIADKVESGDWLNPATTHGFFPTFESVYPGGGLTLGGGWRLFTGYASFVDVRGLYSVKHYKLGEARVRFPKNFGGRFDTGLRGRLAGRHADRLLRPGQRHLQRRSRQLPDPAVVRRGWRGAAAGTLDVPRGRGRL